MQRGLFKEYLNPVRLLSSKLLRLSLSDTGSPVWGTTECPITHYLRHSLFVRFHAAAPRQKIPSLGNFCELLFNLHLPPLPWNTRWTRRPSRSLQILLTIISPGTTHRRKALGPAQVSLSRASSQPQVQFGTSQSFVPCTLPTYMPP